MLEALKNPETLKGLTETESDIQQRIDKFVVILTIIPIPIAFFIDHHHSHRQLLDKTAMTITIS